MDFIKKISKSLFQKPIFHFRDFDEYLKNYFIIRGIGIITSLLLGIVIIFKIHEVDIILAYYGVIIVYFVYQGFILYLAMCDQVKTYEGVCTSRDVQKFELSTKRKSYFNMYGKCSATFSLVGQDSEIFMKVPIGYNFELSEGNVIRVYALKNSVIKKNENTYNILNPVMVKVAKE